MNKGGVFRRELTVKFYHKNVKFLIISNAYLL